MVLKCKHVWEAISGYLDHDLDPEVRRSLEEHLAQCVHCSALLDSTRNVLVLISDERTFSLPVGFSERLAQRLEQEMGKD